MEKLKQKLSSRKLWAGILAAAASVAAIFMGENLTPEIVDALKTLVAACAVYIFGEASVDFARQKYGVDLGGFLEEIRNLEEEEKAEAEETTTKEG